MLKIRTLQALNLIHLMEAYTILWKIMTCKLARKVEALELKKNGQLKLIPEFNREREREKRERERVVLSELHLLLPPLDCSHFWLCCSFQPSLNIDRTDLLSNQRGKRYWFRNISTILHFQFWNYGEVVKLQHSEWICFMISLMAVIDMKAFAICED